MYGNSMYGGGGMYGGGMGGGPMGGYGPNGPYDPAMGPPPAPPTAWQAILNSINGVMMFFGRLSFLVDENAHAVHFFISALLQLLDRTGSLYAEVMRFVLRILFRRRQPKVVPGVHGLPGIPGAPGVKALPAPGTTPSPQQQQQMQQQQLASGWGAMNPGGMPPGAPGWDSMWGK